MPSSLELTPDMLRQLQQAPVGPQVIAFPDLQLIAVLAAMVYQGPGTETAAVASAVTLFAESVWQTKTGAIQRAVQEKAAAPQ